MSYSYDDVQQKIPNITKQDFEFLEKVWPGEAFLPGGMVEDYMDSHFDYDEEDSLGEWGRFMDMLRETYQDVVG